MELTILLVLLGAVIVTTKEEKAIETSMYNEKFADRFETIQRFEG